MVSTTYPTQPLTADEKEHLLFIYHKRRRFFTSSFAGLLIFICVACLYTTVGKTDRSIAKKSDGALNTVNQELLVKFLFLALPTAVIGWGIYRRRVYCFKQDVLTGVKEQLPYTIVRKSYFEHTGQYFLSFDDPNYMHYEVDAAMYSGCKEGDTAYIYRAPRSRYVFDGTGRFSLL